FSSSGKASHSSARRRSSGVGSRTTPSALHLARSCSRSRGSSSTARPVWRTFPTSWRTTASRCSTRALSSTTSRSRVVMQCPSFNEDSLAGDGDGSKRGVEMRQQDGDEAAIIHYDYVIPSYVPVHARIRSRRYTDPAERG